MRTRKSINTQDPRKLMKPHKLKPGQSPVFTQECYMTFPSGRNIRLFTGTEPQNKVFFSNSRVWVHEFKAESRQQAVRETRAKAKELTYSTGTKHKYIA